MQGDKERLICKVCVCVCVRLVVVVGLTDVARCFRTYTSYVTLIPPLFCLC